jgi:hypothetical protein
MAERGSQLVQLDRGGFVGGLLEIEDQVAALLVLTAGQVTR